MNTTPTNDELAAIPSQCPDWCTDPHTAGEAGNVVTHSHEIGMGVEVQWWDRPGKEQTPVVFTLLPGADGEMTIQQARDYAAALLAAADLAEAGR